MATVQTIQGEFRSVEEYSLAVANSGWETDFCQLDRGPGRVSVKMLGTDLSILMYTALEGRVHQRALPPPNHFTCAFLAEEQAPFKISKRSVAPQALLSVDSTTGMDGVSEAQFSGYSVAVCANRVSELAAVAGVIDPADWSEMQGAPCYVGGAALNRLRRLVENMYAGFDPCSDAQRETMAQLLNSDLPLELARMFSQGSRVREEGLSSRRRALQRALEYIHSQPQAQISVETLCTHAACSLSTLERAFREHFAVLPRQYLTALRLGGVRKCLLSPEETRTIGDVAADWGFWHLSKFSSDYKRMFGELPSKTRGLV